MKRLNVAVGLSETFDEPNQTVYLCVVGNISNLRNKVIEMGIEFLTTHILFVEPILRLFVRV